MFTQLESETEAESTQLPLALGRQDHALWADAQVQAAMHRVQYLL